MVSKFNGPDKYKATLETKMVEPIYEAAHSLYAGTMEDIGNDIYMGSFTHPGDPDLFVMEEIDHFFSILRPIEINIKKIFFK